MKLQKAFHLQGKARLSWNTAALEFLPKLAQNNCEGNHFLVEFSSDISYNSFLSLSLQFLKMTIPDLF